MTTGGHVLIADDHPLTREGLSLAARAALPGVTAISAGSIAEAEGVLDGGRTFRIVLLDFEMPDACGYAGFLRLQMAARRTPIAVVSGHEDMALVDAARALGAAGFLFKSVPLDTVADRIRAMVAGQACFPAGTRPDDRLAAMRAKIDALSPAQSKVLLSLADGRLNKQIAGDLNITEATVKAHMSAIFRKLGVDNRTQALLAVQHLIRPATVPPP